MGNGYNVDIPALKTYANNLSFYTSEADKFGTLIDQAEVPEKAWGLVGLFAKQTYSEKLKELEDLLGQMKQGVENFSEKISTAAKVYEGMENDTAMSFGGHQTTIDGPK
ncbi:hypothetical protein [Thermocrispum municipale]|uniref:hypothetical protein n=1 Tax=Thermocrispum municipale TaxID=37926 RepID=UPI00041D9AE6|nr:hypothetical protein [Thermocrispum municipale]